MSFVHFPPDSKHLFSFIAHTFLNVYTLLLTTSLGFSHLPMYAVWVPDHTLNPFKGMSSLSTTFPITQCSSVLSSVPSLMAGEPKTTVFSIYKFIIYKHLFTLLLIRKSCKRLKERRDCKPRIYYFFIEFGDFIQLHNDTVMRISYIASYSS